MRVGEEPIDPAVMVVVPVAPGPLRRLTDVDPGRDDVDDALDELFGAPDDRGPGVADAVLVIGGAGAVVAGQLAELPTAVTVVGALAAALGVILPARSIWRGMSSRRRSRRIGSIVRDGVLMRTDHEQLARIVAGHDRLTALAGDGERADRVRSVAHVAAYEVAVLLEARVPVTAAEREYVAARVAGLEAVAVALTDPALRPADEAERRARVEARHEVEAISGASALTEAADLLRDLRDGRG